MLRNTPLVPKKLALAVGLISSQVAFQAYAQEGNDDLRLEEIIVTSQKRAESLQDVPISVATVNGDKLAEAGIENLEDLTAYLPNIHFTESGFSTQVRVRGIGSDNSQGFEQSVGMYIDGIYYGRAQLFRTPMMDMERAELLRGPQSTLFGKNSIAGALNMSTAKPTDEFEAKLSYSHEFEHEQDEINAVVSGPLSDNFRARLAVRTYEEQGYFYNSYKDLEEPYAEEEAVRLTLDWAPTDNLSFIFKGEQNEFDTFGRAIEITRDEPLTAGDLTYAQWLQQVGAPTFDPDLDYVRQTDANEFSDNEITNLTLTTNYEFDNLTMTLVTGQLEYDYEELCDCDFVAAEILDLELFEEYEQFSQEIRFTSPVGETVEWIAGVYYQDYDQTFRDELITRDTSLLVPLVSSSLANTSADRRFAQESEAWAVFGQVTWNITDSWHLTVGARYTEEDKEATKVINIIDATTKDILTDPVLGFTYLQLFRLENNAAVVDFYPTLPNGDPNPNFGGALPNSGYDVAGARNESAFNPLINIQWDVNGDMMAYASFTTGFKAGGFDPRSNNVGAYSDGSAQDNSNPLQNFEFEEETATAMEIGLKTSLADGRGELNVAGYLTDYEDLQISQFDGGVGFNVGNAKETRVMGLEVDGRWLLTESLTTNFGMSYLDFEYKDFENGNCNTINRTDPNQGTADFNGDGIYELCSYTGQRGVYTPEYTFNLSFDYVQPIMDSLQLVGFIDFQYVDEHETHVNLDSFARQDAYTNINARIGLEGDNWSVGVLGKNLSDEEIITYSGNAPLSDSLFETNTHYSFIRRPMTVALEGTIKF